MDPAFLCAGDIFGDEQQDDQQADCEFVERDHSFPGMTLKVREFQFHQVNANLLWPGSSIFAQWLLDHKDLVSGKRVLELGSGTGALAIFLKKSVSLDITTCDYDDEQIESNIAHNCLINDIHPLPHIRHTWGEEFPATTQTWDVVIASDILLYVNQYQNLIKTLKLLLAAEGDASKPCFIMSWRRRIPKEDEMLFFNGCTEAGFQLKHFGGRVYSIDQADN